MTLLMAVSSASLLATAPCPARAYSSFADYTRSIEEGGGGGRLFTGTPADGYGCKVCHRGAEGAPLQVAGLPENGYVPGQSYEITLLWPETTPHMALMAELTDAAGAPSGVTALASYATLQVGERCAEGGFRAADVCRAVSADSACCRDIDPTSDTCSFPGERSVLWVIDCGSRFARVIWTAPAVASGDVWFSAEMVTSDLQNDARGDGTTSVRTLIRPAGARPEVTTAVSDCAAAPHLRTRSSLGAPLAMLLWLGIWLRARRRGTGWRATGHMPHGPDLDLRRSRR